MLRRLAGLWLSVLVAGCGGPDRPRVDSVVLISVDTLRADRLGLYGNPRPTSPFLDGFATEGTVFETAIATCPATAPAVASMLTGTHRAAHGVRSNGATMPATTQTVAETLRAAGFKTAGRVANPLLESEHGFGQGFDDFAAPAGLVRAGPGMFEGEPVVDDALRLIDQLAAQRFFLWLHFHDPHGPYWPPESVQALFPAASYVVGADRPLAFVPDNHTLLGLPRYQQILGQRLPSEYRARYDAEIRYTDGHLERVIAHLRSRGVLDRTLVIVTADHGESLGEHNYWFQHGWFLYDDCLRVPLVLRAPGAVPAGRRVRASVSMIDLVPTILELTQVDSPVPLEGRSLVPLLDTDGDDRPAFAQTFYGSEKTGVRIGTQQYVRTPAWKGFKLASGKTIQAGGYDPHLRPNTDREELYDLADDPAQSRDRSATDAATRDRLAALVADFLRDQAQRETTQAAVAPATDAPPSPAVQEKLRALGYAD